MTVAASRSPFEATNPGKELSRDWVIRLDPQDLIKVGDRVVNPTGNFQERDGKVQVDGHVVWAQAKGLLILLYRIGYVALSVERDSQVAVGCNVTGPQAKRLLVFRNSIVCAAK